MGRVYLHGDEGGFRRNVMGRGIECSPPVSRSSRSRSESLLGSWWHDEVCHQAVTLTSRGARGSAGSTRSSRV
jgi:hypothetical protein